MIGDLATTVASYNYPIPITQLPNHSITKSTLVTSVAAASSLLLIAALGWPYVSARVRMFKDARDIRSRIVDRLDANAALVRTELETAPMTVAQRAALRARLVEAARGIASIARPDPARFTTVLPLNATHAGILAVHGAMLAATGLPPVVVWKTHRYDAVPPPGSPAATD